MVYIPIEKTNKQKINLTLSQDVITEMRVRRENISAVTDVLLRSYLRLDNKPKSNFEKQKIKEELIKTEVQLANLKQKYLFVEEMEKKEVEDYQNKLNNGDIIIHDV